MSKIEMARLALASEKPDTCTGLPRLPSRRSAQQEARMDIFVPDGYLTLPATIDRVTAIIHGEKLVALSAQEEQKLEREKQRLDDFRRPEPHEWTGPRHRDAAVKIPELSDAEFQDLESKSAEVAEQRDAAWGVLRQYLFARRLRSEVLDHQGHRYNIPSHVWGGDEGLNTLRSAKVGVGSDMGSVTGLVIIEANALEAAFGTEKAVRTNPRPVGSTAASSKRSAEPNLTGDSRRKGGSAPKYNAGLQQFIDQLFVEFEGEGVRLTLFGLKTWLERNAQPNKGYDPEPPIPDCGDIEFYDKHVWWKNKQSHQKSTALRTLERYIQRAGESTSTEPA